MSTVAASEQDRAQTGGLRAAGVADRHNQTSCQLNHLERWAREGDSPVSEDDEGEAEIQSTTEHEEFCGKQGGPPSKAKDYMATDSA